MKIEPKLSYSSLFRLINKMISSNKRKHMLTCKEMARCANKKVEKEWTTAEAIRWCYTSKIDTLENLKGHLIEMNRKEAGKEERSA